MIYNKMEIERILRIDLANVIGIYFMKIGHCG